jgi:nitrite reductase/ring-hydroxylating ferredoxin subunit
MIIDGLHVCECGNKIFAIVGECSNSNMLYAGMCVMCIKCNSVYDAKTGEKIEI